MNLQPLWNLRGFYNSYCALLDDDQRSMFSYVDSIQPAIVMLQGVLSLSVQPHETGFDASFSALQVKEVKIYKYGAHLLESFATAFLEGKNPDERVSVALYGAGYQCTIPILNLKMEPQYSHGILMKNAAEREVKRITGVTFWRK